MFVEASVVLVGVSPPHPLMLPSAGQPSHHQTIVSSVQIKFNERPDYIFSFTARKKNIFVIFCVLYHNKNLIYILLFCCLQFVCFFYLGINCFNVSAAAILAEHNFVKIISWKVLFTTLIIDKNSNFWWRGGGGGELLSSIVQDVTGSKIVIAPMFQKTRSRIFSLGFGGF